MSLSLNITYNTIITKFVALCYEVEDRLPYALRIILAKISSNLDSANMLIENKCYNEASIILRSATESVILFCYLMQFPEKIEDYLSDSQMLKFKNSFMSYKKSY